MLSESDLETCTELIQNAANSQLYKLRDVLERELDLSEACIADGEEQRR